MLLRAEVVRRECTKNGKACKPRAWKYGDCVGVLAACSRGFHWTDPEPVNQPVEPSARMSAHKEGARATNFIAANAAAYRKSKGVDCRQDLDAKMAKTPAERDHDSFWSLCAEAVQSKGTNPEIDEMQVDGIYYGSVDPSLPDGGCCPALERDACALKLKAMMKTVSSQASQAMWNMQQSGEGDLAADMDAALDGDGEFPDICGKAVEGESEQRSGSSPYDFLAVGIVSYCCAMLSKDGLLLASTTMLSPAAQSSSSSGSVTSKPLRRKTPTKTPTLGDRQADAGAEEVEVDGLGGNGFGDVDGDSASLLELATQSRAANEAAQDAVDSVKEIAAVLGMQQPMHAANLETEQVADVKAKRFEVCLDELSKLAEGHPFKLHRTRIKAKQAYNAGVAIDMPADDVLNVIAEALDDHIGDFEATLRALDPDAAKVVFG